MLASQQVIAGIVSHLVAAATSAAGRVYSDRFHPVDTYPSIRVQHVDEDLQAEDDDITWPAQRLHSLQVDVVALQRAVSGLDAALSDLVAQVLTALQGTQAAATLSPLVGCQLVATGIRYQAQTDGEAATGTATVRVLVLFHTASNNPSTLI